MPSAPGRPPYRRANCRISRSEATKTNSTSINARGLTAVTIETRCADTEQDQSADRAPEHRAPTETSLRGDDRRLNWDRQQRRLKFRRDLDRPARRAA